MAIASQPVGVVRVARRVLATIVINTALQIPGVIRMAQRSEQWSRLLGREISQQGVALTVKDTTVSADLYIVVSASSDIVEVGTAIQEEVASAIEEMIGLQVQEVNVYIQDIA
jgi:uncharacterized alkaline shock family protein YloU